MIKLFLVDDDNIVLEGLSRLISDIPNMTVVGSAHSGEEAIKLIQSKDKKPDVILMDLQMPGIGGLEAARKMLLRDSSIKIIVLTVYAQAPMPSTVLQLGVLGYLSKQIAVAEMIEAIQAVYLGKRYIASTIAEQLAFKKPGDQRSRLELLSMRELQVMMKIVHGEAVEDIAKRFNLSPKTINGYRYELFKKLGISNNVELTHLALQHGLLDPIEMKS